MNIAKCHPDRTHYGKGKCKPCYMRRWADANPGLLRDSARARYAANPPKHRAKNRLYLYGMTPDEYREQVIGQTGRCLICLRVPDHNLHVDHDHQTGKIRGLLCNQCNRGMGLLRDDPKVAHSAAAYLERSA